MEISYMILIVGGTFQGKKAFAEKLLNEKRVYGWHKLCFFGYLPCKSAVSFP